MDTAMRAVRPGCRLGRCSSCGLIGDVGRKCAETIRNYHRPGSIFASDSLAFDVSCTRISGVVEGSAFVNYLLIWVGTYDTEVA
jgi:hypothetical protein